MSYNFKIGELKENARYTVSTVDKWDGSTKTEEMSGASLKSFTNGCAHLYDIHAEEIPAEEPADPAAEVFPELVKAVNAEAELRKDGKRFYIENGFCRTWAAEHRTDPDRGLKEWSTQKKWGAYQAGTLPREKAVEIAQKRAAADVEKWREQQLSKLRTAAAAPALSFLSVSVEWKRSSVWGHNPTATARTDDGTFTGYASGCGYDKESAAVGEALNKSPAVMRVLYQAAEQAMKNG